MNRQGGGDMMRFEDFGCEGTMSRDKIGVASWCSGLGGSEKFTYLAFAHSLRKAYPMPNKIMVKKTEAFRSGPAFCVDGVE